MTYEELGRQMVYAAAVGETLDVAADFHFDALHMRDVKPLYLERCFDDARRDLQNRGLL